MQDFGDKRGTKRNYSDANQNDGRKKQRNGKENYYENNLNIVSCFFFRSQSLSSDGWNIEDKFIQNFSHKSDCRSGGKILLLSIEL